MKYTIIYYLAFCFCLVSCSENNTKQKEYAISKRFEKTWPNGNDLEWFKEAKGKSAEDVLKLLGPPIRKEPTGSGGIRWYYPWAASASVDFENGKAISTFYTAGY